MPIVRRSLRRRVGAFSSGGGVYRRPFYIIQSIPIAIPDGYHVAASAGSSGVEVGGTVGATMPILPGVNGVEVGGSPAAILTDGQFSVVAGVNGVEIGGFVGFPFYPPALMARLSAAIRRRRYAALYGQTFPLPDFDANIQVVMRPLPYRVVTATAGVVEVGGFAHNLLLDENLYLPGSSPNGVEVGGFVGDIGELTTFLQAAQAAAIEVGGFQGKAEEVLLEIAAGAPVGVEVVGYNAPRVVTTGAWYDSGEASGTWEAVDTAASSWSDTVVVTTIWRKQ